MEEYTKIDDNILEVKNINIYRKDKQSLLEEKQRLQKDTVRINKEIELIDFQLDVLKKPLIELR